MFTSDTLFQGLASKPSRDVCGIVCGTQTKEIARDLRFSRDSKSGAREGVWVRVPFPVLSSDQPIAALLAPEGIFEYVRDVDQR